MAWQSSKGGVAGESDNCCSYRTPGQHENRKAGKYSLSLVCGPKVDPVDTRDKFPSRHHLDTSPLCSIRSPSHRDTLQLAHHGFRQEVAKNTVHGAAVAM